MFKLSLLLNAVKVFMIVPFAFCTILFIDPTELKGSIPPPTATITVLMSFKLPILWIWLVIVGPGLKS